MESKTEKREKNSAHKRAEHEQNRTHSARVPCNTYSVLMRIKLSIKCAAFGVMRVVRVHLISQEKNVSFFHCVFFRIFFRLFVS